MSLSGKTILITGAAGGLGTALALQCAKAGAELVLLDKDRRGLNQLSDKITDQNLTSPGLYPMDLAGAGLDDFNDLAEIVGSEFGGLYALIHCALDFDGLQPLEQVAPQDWLQSMQVNVNAPWLLSCALLPLLKQSKNGRITSSGTGSSVKSRAAKVVRITSYKSIIVPVPSIYLVITLVLALANRIKKGWTSSLPESLLFATIAHRRLG